jgi:hypothetical protein
VGSFGRHREGHHRTDRQEVNDYEMEGRAMTT